MLLQEACTVFMRYLAIGSGTSQVEFLKARTQLFKEWIMLSSE